MFNRQRVRQWLMLIGILMLMLTVVSPTRAAVNWPTVSEGASGDVVVALQGMLRQAGYTISFNGLFDATTRGEVIRFQQAQGLPATGIVDATTWERLTTQPTSTLSSGSNNDLVDGLQRLLRNNYGYDLGIDGGFGEQTAGKVISFQKSVNIGADGVVGPTTWFHLISGDTARISHANALQQLQNAGIGVTSSQGVVISDRTVPGTTSLEQVRQSTISGLIEFQQRTGCPILVTGATETFIHVGGAQSHHTGYKIDIDPNGCVDSYITSQTPIGGNLYQDAQGYVYFDERSSANHWDIRFP